MPVRDDTPAAGIANRDFLGADDRLAGTVVPPFDIFAQAYASGTAQVVWTRLVADLETPVSAMLKLAAGRSDCFLLESVEGGAVRGRYSIIGIEPDLIFRAVGDKAEINTDPKANRVIDRRTALSDQPRGPTTGLLGRAIRADDR